MSDRPVASLPLSEACAFPLTSKLSDDRDAGTLHRSPGRMGPLTAGRHNH